MIAYLDESARQGPFGLAHVLAAAVIIDDPDAARDEMSKLRRPRQRAVHWHDESASRRLVLIRAVCGLGIQAFATTAHPVASSRLERARQRCLVAITEDLAGEGVDELVIESRDVALDYRDRRSLAGAQRAGIAAGVPYGHTMKRSEPLLWAADVIAGAVSMHVAGVDSTYFVELNASLLHIRDIGG